MRIPPVGHSGSDLSAPDRCKGDTLPSIGERQTYDTTTILGAWRQECACCPRCALYHTVLFRVSRPGGIALCPGGRILAQRPLSGAAPGRNAPAHVVDHRAPSAPASSAWTVHSLPCGCRNCVLRHLR